MRVVALSDTHDLHDKVFVPNGDMLIYAGDMTSTGTVEQTNEFLKWFMWLPHTHKILIAGNHDFYMETEPNYPWDDMGIHYLLNDTIEIDGLRIFGSPFTPKFGGWAFMHNEKTLEGIWKMIDKVDILVTHGPPKFILDRTEVYDTNAGSKTLGLAVTQNIPRYHIFGHIHEGYGSMDTVYTKFINVSICNFDYEPVNKPVTFNI